jgi:hypothetical protein
MLCLTDNVASPSHERALLIALLQALEDPERAAALPPDDEALVVVAHHHRLTALLSASAGKRLAPPLAELFRRDRLAVVVRGLLLEQVAGECLRALADAGVRVAVLKGLDYAKRLYSSAGSRATSDIDLLVPGADRRSAFQVLDRLGFEPRAAAPGFDEPDYHEVAWNRAGVEVDLHLALAPLVRCRIDYQAVWAEVETVALGDVSALVLSRTHAAVFHALHMAIDHFDVPAMYLVDLARLLPDEESLRVARTLAESWRCRRPLETAVALTAAFLPRWRGGGTASRTPIREKIAARYGSTVPLPRAQQLVRKLAHFDHLTDAFRYVVVQSRRNLREEVERRTRRRSARERLHLPRKSAAADSGG